MHRARARLSFSRLRVSTSLGALLLASSVALVPAFGQTAPTPPSKDKAKLPKTLTVAPPSKPGHKPEAKATAKSSTSTAKRTIDTTSKKPPAAAALGYADPRPTGSIAQAMPSFGGNLGGLQQAVSLVEKGDANGALDAADRLSDPGQQALVRWLALRVTACGVGFDRV